MEVSGECGEERCEEVLKAVWGSVRGETWKVWREVWGSVGV